MSGSVPARGMSRLAAMFVELQDLGVNLHFSWRGPVVLVEGDLNLRGTVVCQRCLGAMPLLMKLPVRVGVGESEAAVAAVDPDLDAVLAPEGRLALREWLEDEYLLAMPIAPRCDVWKGGVCPISGIAPPEAPEGA